MSSLLVEVVRITEVLPHPNADRLEIAKVKGWQCVVGKNDCFQQGSLAVFIPPDCILPEPLIERLKLGYLKKNGRTGTVKLRGELSEGLLLPILGLVPSHPIVGDNVADHLGITKYEPPEPEYQRGTQPHVVRNRPNPNFTRYCDPENIKHYPDVFEIGERVFISEKIHGTSVRCGWIPRYYRGFWGQVKRVLLGWHLGEWEWCVGSRKVHLLPGRPQFYKGNVYHGTAERLDLKRKLPKGFTVYGEIFGPGIQKHYSYGCQEIAVRFYDVKDGDRYLSYADFCAFCLRYGLVGVPRLYVGPYYPGLAEEHAGGQSVLDPNTVREGCVIKTADEGVHPKIGRKILKALSTEYLMLKNGTDFH